jgi:metallo-beta-lactamase class B
MWGGTGVPRDAASREAYIASAAKFDIAAKKAGADIELSNHPFVDDSLNRMAQMRSNPDKANPFVIGRAAYGRYSAIIAECAKAVAAGGPTAG